MSCLNTLTVINREKKWHKLSRMREVRIFGGHKLLHKKRKFLLLNDKITTFESFYYNLEFFEYRLKNVWNHVKNLLRITRLQENFVVLIKRNSVCTVSYSMVKVPCGALGSSIYDVHMKGTCGWMIWILKTQTITALILLYTIK